MRSRVNIAAPFSGVVMTQASKIRVLHLDDDPCTLRISKIILERIGEYQVESVLSVEEAFAKMGKDEYDVIVSDYHMPGKDGLQFLKELRGKGNRISFVLFSGEASDKIRTEALSFGADGYIYKIGSPETVYAELSNGIESALMRANKEINA
jgi:CheY-like chemotaxis protein